MGRGLSKQQRAILALARAFNATQNGGHPASVPFDFHAMPGDVLPGGQVAAVAELGWAARLPDYTQPFGLAVLDGFQRIRWHCRQWNPATVCRKRQMSMARAVNGLLARGMLCHAIDPTTARRWLWVAEGQLLNGWGTSWHGDKDVATDGMRQFWTERNRPAYWLTPAGHDAAGAMWERHDAAAIVATYMHVARVWRRGGREHEWMRYTSAEAEQAARKKAEAFCAGLAALLAGRRGGRRRATAAS